MSIILGCLGMAGVAAAQLVDPSARVPADMVFVLDNSGSMKKRDPNFLVKVAVQQFATGAAQDTRIAMVICDEAVDLVTPLTFGTGSSSWPGFTNLEQLNYQGLATNIPSGIDRALQELQRNGRKRAVRSIVLLTDGVSDTGDQALHLEKARRLMEQLGSRRGGAMIHIYAVALADRGDFHLLRALAMETGGEYFYAEHAEEVFPIFARIQSAVRHEQSAASERASLAVPPGKVASRQGGEFIATDLAQPSAHSDAAVNEKALVSPGVGWLVAVSAGLLLVGISITGFLLHKSWAWRGTGMPVAFPAGSWRSGRVIRAYLYDIGRVTKRKRYELSSRVLVIGRRAPRFAGVMMDAIVIAKPTISRCHATIEYRDDGFWIRDENSRNGTFVNGARVSGETRLRHGDRIRFHDWDFGFELVGFGDDYETVMVGHGAWPRGVTDS
ncbi:MAG: FHA domain-containing protein [Gammaproteobacteria bacterium]